jgi:hypothetical protein
MTPIQNKFDLTPDPKVLLALARTPLQPMDALCELIDNAIDSFAAGTALGVTTDGPIVSVDLPTKPEVRAGEGALVITDNGPGMTAADAERALRAGFSANNQFDRLGLFGMGFNIATAKIGRVTTLVSDRARESDSISVTVDLDAILQAKSFSVPYRTVPRQQTVSHGTKISVSGWWPLGDPNHGFVGKLLQYGLPTIRSEIGRRYASILRRNEIRIVLNSIPVDAFEHCVWGASRFVERRGQGQIPARFDFDEVLTSSRKCAQCGNQADEQTTTCPSCRNTTFRSIEERIRGWLGVQRYDSSTEFGVDLIRNGRAIRIGEKAAFFEFVDALKRSTRDYPIDQPYGRLIGEVHLDHVPVDFLKQDFQRSSPEWARALTYLRGDSSLQPNAPGATENRSPMFKLYQGYRRVRTPGKADLYMGYWDREEAKPKRVSRDNENEYLEKFVRRIPGYFDDAEWWKRVEQADAEPPAQLSTCPTCQAQNPSEADMCAICGGILRGRPCINPQCNATVAESAESCPSCGTRQFADDVTPWACTVCSRSNAADDAICAACGAPKGSTDPLSEEALRVSSHRVESLCRQGFSTVLPNGTQTAQVNVETLAAVRPLIPHGLTSAVPLVRFRTLDGLTLVVDRSHPLFRGYRASVESIVAREIADFLVSLRPSNPPRQEAAAYTTTALSYQVLQGLLREPEGSPERFAQAVTQLLDDIRERLRVALDGVQREFYDDMSPNEKKELADQLIRQGHDLRSLDALIDDGRIVAAIGFDSILRAIEEYPERVFDGGVWELAYQSLADIMPEHAAERQGRMRKRAAQLLRDVNDERTNSSGDSALVDRASSALRYLNSKLCNVS